MEIMNDFLYSVEKEVPVFIDDQIGDLFGAGETVKLIWESFQDDDNEDLSEQDLDANETQGSPSRKIISIMFDNDACECFLDQTFREAAEQGNREIICNKLIDVTRLWSFDIEERIGGYYQEGDELVLYWDLQDEDSQGQPDEALETPDMTDPEDTEEEEIPSHLDVDLSGRKTGPGDNIGCESAEEDIKATSVVDCRPSTEDDQKIEDSTTARITGHSGDSSATRQDHPGNDEFQGSGDTIKGETAQNIAGRETYADSDRAKTALIYQELSLLKKDNAGYSAIILFGGQSRQIFFDPPSALQTLTKKIKEIWNIPRKIYWLSVNGKHESKVTLWPLVSNVEIKIRGLGAGPVQDIKSDEVRICLEGKVTTENYEDDFDDLLERLDLSSVEEIWVSNRQRVDIFNILKKFAYPGTGKIFIYDRVLSSDPEVLKRGALGKVKLKLEGQIIETWNNMGLEAALLEQKIKVESHFLRIPSLGISVDARLIRIRSLAPACARNPLLLKWDIEIQESLKKGTTPIRTDGVYFTENPNLDEPWSFESDYSLQLGNQLMENFRKTGKFDWRIVYGDDEIEKPTMKGTKIAFTGERFTWDEDSSEVQAPHILKLPHHLGFSQLEKKFQ
jgi:hypothetical protein